MEIQGVAQLDHEGAQARIAEGALLVDVRERGEFQQAHIPGSTLLPMSEIQDRVDELPKDRHIVLMCRSGNRSQQVAAWLRPQGYDVSNLMHGIMGWARMGQPVEQG